MGLIQKVFGTHSQHELKRIYPIVDHIEALEPEMQKLSDEELRDKTREYKERYAKGETLDDLLPEAFATVREAAVRSIGMKHYRVQLIGGIVLHQGRIAHGNPSAADFQHFYICIIISKRYDFIRNQMKDPCNFTQSAGLCCTGL